MTTRPNRKPKQLRLIPKSAQSQARKSQAVIVLDPAQSLDVSPLSREAPPQLAVTAWNEIIQSVITQEQFRIISGRTPEYAIKRRAGGGGAIFRYVPHGYVRKKLNEAFGFDYDFKVLPHFAGMPYGLIPREETVKGGREIVQYLVVLGELTIRLHDPKDIRKVLTTIIKQDFGSQAWRTSMELGDALKAASSDALKRCGLGLGIALDLYFDDEAAAAHWTQQQMQRSAVAKSAVAPNASDKPSDPMELLARAATELALDADQIEALAHVTVPDLMNLAPAEVSALWSILLKGKSSQ